MKKHLSVKIQGMSCVMCARAVETSLGALKGIESANVNLSDESASIDYNPNEISFTEIQKAIERAGYKTMASRAVIRITGMSCVMCSRAVEQALSAIQGVFSATVDYAAGRAEILYDSSRVSQKHIQKAIESAGYHFAGASFDPDVAEKLVMQELFWKKIRFSVGILVGMIAMALMYFPVGQTLPLHHVLFAITTPVFLFVSYPIFTAAYFSLKNKALTMDVMYAMGIGISYLSSILGTFGVLPSEFMYYETALFLASFLMLGRFLEARARGKTSQAIRKLMNLRPKAAHLVTDDGVREIAQEEITAGNILLVKPGEAIPTDGVIIAGESYIDQSMLTGEALPVPKSAGDTVTGGCINLEGSFTMKAERTGNDTILSQIIRIVEDAQSSKPALQNIADRTVVYFIPFILVVAMITFAVWFFMPGSSPSFAIARLISVLVIACPCALGLATPTAVTAGIGRGAQLGILIKHSEALELSEKISTVVFDKTGTLTTGKPEVSHLICDGLPEHELLHIAAGLEAHASHPLARAIASYAHSRNITALQFESVSTFGGLGVSAQNASDTFLAGSARFFNEQGCIIPAQLAQSAEAFEKQGGTTVFVGKNGRAYGVFGIFDTIKEGAKEAVAMLKAMRLSVMMITGDNARSARAVGAMLGIDSVISDVLPHEKGEKIRALQIAGNKVLFVGDGINDAPPLAMADIGIAVAGGTDIALEAGSMVLLGGDLRDVPAALNLGRRVTRRIRQNIFWAFAYNILLVPVAAGALYPFFGITLKPELAGLAMALSSVTVVTLSLTLTRYNPRKETGTKL